MTTPHPRPNIVIDAGPALNFFSLSKQGILIDCLGPLSMPQTVVREVQRKAEQDRRFSAAAGVLRNLRGSVHLNILEDNSTNPALAAAAGRISLQPLAERLRRAADQGELMVISHTAVLVEAGANVTMLIDDGPARQLAKKEITRLQALRTQNPATGCAYLISTPQVLTAAIGTRHIPDKKTMRELFGKMRTLDDGLTAETQSRLLEHANWYR
ncbi:MAG: hypothetical protein R2720_04415 [Candidatus Nanopelagicales bacterium]